MRRILFAIAVILSGVLATTAWSAWTAGATNSGNVMTAKADWQAPVISAGVVAKSTGGSSAYIRQAGGYYIYATVADSGNPASGTKTVVVNATTVTTTATAAALTAGTYPVEGVSYNYRSALLTANSVLAAGPYNMTVTTTDQLNNTAAVTSPAVTVDNTKPTGTDVQTANGGTAARPDAGDTIAFTYSEPMDPSSILSGWDGTASPVQVVITNSITDLVTVRTSNGVTQLPLGSLNTKGDYVSANTTYNATMVHSGSAITITLGTVISGTPRTATVAAALSWTSGSVAGAADRAGNTLTSSTVTETGTSEIDF
jgi:chitinase